MKSKQLAALTPQVAGKTFRGIFIGTPGTGQEVDPVLADACIQRYKDEMGRRFILAPGETPPTTPTTDILKITHYVNFSGRDLMYWILEQCFKPDAQDAVDFKLANGIYTEEFLDHYFPGQEEEQAKRRNRITTFILPYERPEQEKPDAPAVRLSGGSAYDLGGLEP